MTHARSKSDSTQELMNVYGSPAFPKKPQCSPKSSKKHQRNNSSCIDTKTEPLDKNLNCIERPLSANGSEFSGYEGVDDVNLKTQTPRAENVEQDRLRLLLLSDKTSKSHRVSECCLPNVLLVHYKNDSSTLDNLLLEAKYKVGENKVHSIAFMSHSVDSMLHLCSSVEKHFTQNPILIPEVKNFFLGMKQLLCNNSPQCQRDIESNTKNEGADVHMTYCNHIDFLGMKLSSGLNTLVKELSKFLELKVGLSQDAGGCDLRLDKEEKDQLNMSVLSHAVAAPLSSPVYVGQCYFEMDKLRALTMSVPQSMAGFEKIRLVGKGAYGAAVLYRKKDDDSLVILKEINMIDLSASERQLALNEVKILSLLDHPNIISYYDHFEEDGVLIIEMEYADGGTLGQMLSQRTSDSMEESEILLLFQQMVAALRHIHSHNVLHRDFKTDNIFLTKEGIVKLGDFGISKMMTSTRRLASTVLGTPYYISPELCEGKEYNEKSDIWALGCVLYEMACGQKTFDGSNLPALVNKIMKGQFAPIKSSFSQSFRVLIRDMLQRDPQYRPSAHEILYMRLPELMKKVSSDKVAGVTNMSKSSEFVEVAGSANGGGDKSVKRASSAANKRSLVFEFNLLTMKIEPVHFPFRVTIKQICASSTHAVAVSSEMSVFTWGEGSKGQLGHENLENCAVAAEVESLRGKSIVRVGAGDGFTVFGCDNGILLTCGDGAKGCLGHGDWNSCSKARLIENLLSVDIVSFGCGSMHVAAVSSEGSLYAWGVGADGRLGLSDCLDKNKPTLITAHDSAEFHVREVQCGLDGTMFLTDMGCVLACGSNALNKLGLNNRQGFLMGMKNFISKIEVEGSNVPIVVKCLAKHRVMKVSMGKNHTAVTVEQGHVYILGSNAEGQLGTGSLKQKNSPAFVKDLEHEKAVWTACGDGYTMLVTKENVIHAAGIYPKMEASPIVSESNNTSASSGANPNGTNASGGDTPNTSLPITVLNVSGANSGANDSPQERNTSQNSNPNDNSGLSTTPPVNSILKQPKSPAVTRSALRASNETGTSPASDLVPLSNVPEEIGLAFHVSEPAAVPNLNFTPIIKFVPDVFSTSPQGQSNTDGGSSSQKQPNGLILAAKSVDIPESHSATSGGRPGLYVTTIECLVCMGSQSHSVLICVETDAPMPKKRPKRRRIKRLKESGGDGIGGPFEEKPGVSSAESSLNGNNQQNKKRFSGGVSSQDGDYTTEGDSELSEQDGPADALQQTSSSTVPTWLRNELADEFVPIPSSIGPDSCYSSEEEDNAENSASRKTSDASNTNENQEDETTPRAPTSSEHERNGNLSKVTSKRYKDSKDESSRPGSTSSYDLKSENNFNKKDACKHSSNKASNKSNHNPYMSTSNSSADLMFVPAPELTVKPTSAKQRSPSNRPSTVKTSNVANFPGQTKNQPPRRATTAASAAANRPPTSVNRGVSNPQKTSDRGGAAMKPTAIVGPESRRNNPTGLKSSNETRLEEELAQLRREKEEMMLLIQQMQQDQLNSGDVTRRSGASTAQSSQVSHPAVSDTLRDELAQMKNELVSQRRLLAENAAEMNRLQQQITVQKSPNHLECGGPDGLLSSSRADEHRQQSMKSSPSQHSSLTNDSRSSNERPKPKSKTSKVCSLS